MKITYLSDKDLETVVGGAEALRGSGSTGFNFENLLAFIKAIILKIEQDKRGRGARDPVAPEPKPQQ